jgi:hypothetical protein
MAHSPANAKRNANVLCKIVPNPLPRGVVLVTPKPNPFRIAPPPHCPSAVAFLAPNSKRRYA